MPILRAYGGSPSTRRSPNRMSPPSTGEKPAIMRSSVVLPQPDGPSSVNSSPSPISSVTRSTAVAAPNRLVTSRSAILIRSRFLPDRLDVAAEPRLERLRALGGHGLVVDVRHVAISRGEVAGVGGQLLEPVPALLLPVHGQDHLVRRVRRRRARGRALRDLALEPGIEQIVPLLRLRHAEALDLLGVIDQAVGLQRGADPVAGAVLQRDRLGLADRRGDRLPRLARDLDLLEELLVGELLEERRLAAPEDVHLRLALPF